ncbi:MAG: hypothetical protein ACXU8A_06060, partial [Burkholderiaceae bacterium]
SRQKNQPPSASSLPSDSTSPQATVVRPIRTDLADLRILLHEHLEDDVCEETMQSISRTLCGVDQPIPDQGSLKSLHKEFQVAHAPDRQTLYSIHLPQLRHSLSILRTGNKAILLQSYVGNYTLGEWMDEIGQDSKTNSWYPRNGEKDIASFSNYLLAISRVAKKIANCESDKEKQMKSLESGIKQIVGPLSTKSKILLVTLCPSYILKDQELKVCWAKADVNGSLH